MINQVVVFPDAVDVVRTYIEACLVAREHEATAHNKVPDPRPEYFVTISRGGGVATSIVTDAPTLLFECWAPTPEEAHDLAQLCRGLSFAMRGTSPSGVPVYRIEELAGPAELPDDISNQSRYVFTHSVGMRGTAL